MKNQSTCALHQKRLLTVVGCIMLLSNPITASSAPAPDQSMLQRLPAFEEFVPKEVQPSIIANNKIPPLGSNFDRWALRPVKDLPKAIIPKTITPGQNQNVTNDATQDYESSIVSVDLNGVTYVTTAFIKDNGSGNQRINFYTTTPNSPQSWSGVLPMPTGYTRTVDPYLAVNQYNSGVGPNTMYLVGLAINGTTATRAIIGWSSSDGGRTWLGPAIIDTATTTPVMDKPHITVSERPATLGHIYVGYRDEGGAQVMRKSSNGGINWDPERIISNFNAGLTFGVQLSSSPYSNIIYAFWTDFTDDRIKWARSLDQGVTWSGAANFSNAQNLIGEGGLSGMRRPSFPIIRYNWVNPRISVVWHECSQAPSGTGTSKTCPGNIDVYYAALNSSGAINKVRINDDTGTTDQFLPALDFDSTGNVMSTFYDRRNGGTGYRLYRAYINDVGTALLANQDVSTVTHTTTDFIGDYHEIWNTNINGISTWISSWVGVNNASNRDIFLSPIRP